MTLNKFFNITRSVSNRKQQIYILCYICYIELMLVLFSLSPPSSLPLIHSHTHTHLATHSFIRVQPPLSTRARAQWISQLCQMVSEYRLCSINWNLYVCFVDLMRKVTFPFVEGWNWENQPMDSFVLRYFQEIYADNFVEL